MVNIFEQIIKHHPELREKYQSEQYKMSNKLIDFKVENNLTQREMAELISINYSEYLDLEYCTDWNVPIERYANALSKLKEEN